MISQEYPEKVDLENCAKEPIHIIGKTQEYGVLVVCDPLSLERTLVIFCLPGRDMR